MKRRQKQNEVKFATLHVKCVCVFLREKTKTPSSIQALNYLPSPSCWFLCRLLLLSGLFRYHGDWRGAAALQASARFVRSCVQVNTFCSRPSVQAQICMRVGRLGWKRWWRGREREREMETERREERKEKWWKETRDGEKGGRENSDICTCTD